MTFLTAAACAADSVSCCCSPLPGRAVRSSGNVPPSFPAVSVRQAAQLNNHIFLRVFYTVLKMPLQDVDQATH